MKRFLILGCICLSVMAYSCGGGGPTPTPTPRPTNTAIPSPTATAVPTEIPPTATPVPPTPTPTATPIVPTTDPNMETYKLARTVGVNQNAYSEAWPFPRHGGILDQFTTKELFDELSGYGINAVRLWLSVPYNDGFNGPPLYEDMHEVWSHPGITTMVVIFTNEDYGVHIKGCKGGNIIDAVNEPTDEIVDFLYANYGDLEKTIIITEPEVDNLWRGYDCTEPDEGLWSTWDGSADCRATKTDEECVLELSHIRLAEVLARASRRQAAVERGRRENPDAKLVVASSMTVSQFEDHDRFFGMLMLRDGVPLMPRDPDYLGLSQTASGGKDFAFPIMQTQKFTGFPVDRLFVDQVYTNESYPGKQYNLIKPAIEVAFDWDIQAAFIWMWRQGWISYDAQGRPENKGMWAWLNEIGVPGKVQYGGPNSGLQVIQEMNPGATTPTPVPTTPPTATPVPPTATPTATPTPADPCAHCPDPASFSCQMWPDTCIQCWNDCGQPYVTPTPTRTPTRTKTPTPKPGDCSHCPDPNSMSCQMWPHTCAPCWEACGQPLATPTPRPTSTPTPTPTPHISDSPLLSFNYEGYPVGCDVALFHEDTGFTKTIYVPECKPINLKFEKVGVWQIQMTAQYAHGWALGQSEQLPPTPAEAQDPLFVKKIQGDVDADGKYEFVYIRKINVLPRPAGPGPIA